MKEHYLTPEGEKRLQAELLEFNRTRSKRISKKTQISNSNG